MRAVRTPERQESRKTFLGSNGGCQSVREEGHRSADRLYASQSYGKILYHVGDWGNSDRSFFSQLRLYFRSTLYTWPRAGIARTTRRCRLRRCTQSAAKLGEKLPAGISFGPSPPPKERDARTPEDPFVAPRRSCIPRCMLPKTLDRRW